MHALQCTVVLKAIFPYVLLYYYFSTQLYCNDYIGATNLDNLLFLFSPFKYGKKDSLDPVKKKDFHAIICQTSLSPRKQNNPNTKGS